MQMAWVYRRNSVIWRHDCMYMYNVCILYLDSRYIYIQYLFARSCSPLVQSRFQSTLFVRSDHVWPFQRVFTVPTILHPSGTIYVYDLHGTHMHNESLLCGISTVPVSTYIIIDNLHELTILLGAWFLKDFLFWGVWWMESPAGSSHQQPSRLEAEFLSLDGLLQRFFRLCQDLPLLMRGTQ